MIAPRLSVSLAALLILLSGCLPYSCRREESTAILPSDSLSRQVADRIDIVSLTPGWRRASSDSLLMAHPRTIRFDASGALYVSDAERGTLISFDPTGRVRAEMQTEGVPYLAGIRKDTIVVFDPTVPAFQFYVDGNPVDRVVVKDPDRPASALVYGAYSVDLFYKRVDADERSFVATVGRDGVLTGEIPLDGPHWRHAGLLRVWGDSVVSLSGFRPVIDVVTDRGEVDTLALHGFDSPMLARSRAFVLGDVHEAPLLTSSAAPTGDRLFVLNMRAGWLHIDVFDRRGRLLHRLEEREQTYQKSFFPQDLDVRLRSDGAYEIAVVLTQPQPEVRTYTWHP